MCPSISRLCNNTLCCIHCPAWPVCREKTLRIAPRPVFSRTNPCAKSSARNVPEHLLSSIGPMRPMAPVFFKHFRPNLPLFRHLPFRPYARMCAHRLAVGSFEGRYSLFFMVPASKVILPLRRLTLSQARERISSFRIPDYLLMPSTFTRLGNRWNATPPFSFAYAPRSLRKRSACRIGLEEINSG